MGTYKGTEGQTIIETAIMLVLFLLILLGITEFSRAWYTKNSLKNAVRQGARVAVVTQRDNIPKNSFSCATQICPNVDVIINAVCCQPGVPRKDSADITEVTLTCTNSFGSTIDCDTIVSDGTVKVTAVYKRTDFFIVGDPPWPWPKSITMTADASMRYE